MRREHSALAVAVLSGLLSSAHGQKLDIKPGVDVLATATTNASNNASAPRKDLVINVTPELSLSYVGARSRIDSLIRVDNVHFVRNSQPDQTLPSGHLALHSDLIDQWGGLDTSVQTSQTPASLLARQSDTKGVADSYTTTQARIAPFISHAFDANTELKARLERSVTQSSEITATQAKRPDLQQAWYSAHLERQPLPLGAWVDWAYEDRHEDQPLPGQPDEWQKKNAVRTGVSYALNEQVRVGLTLGRESFKVPGFEQQETIRGGTLIWRPNERATLNTTVEHRFFGTGWKLDWTHRRPQFVWSVISQRDASTYTQPPGTLRGNLNEATNNGPLPNGPATQAVPDPYLTASLQQTLQGRFVLMGRRNTLTMSGGVNKTGPLNVGAANSAALNNDQTLERFVDAQFNRRLTPFTDLNAGVRWGTSSVVSTVNPSGRSRNLVWRSAINTKVSPQTTATIGLRHQTTEGNQANASDESAMFVGLGYRY
jgi:uncharacterized protein (PEP-CTERM system associated)